MSYAKNDVAIPSYCRKMLKQLISNKIPDVEFHSPKRVNVPERVTVKENRDNSILLHEDYDSKDTQMKSIYDAAAMLQKCTINARVGCLQADLMTLATNTFQRSCSAFSDGLFKVPKH